MNFSLFNKSRSVVGLDIGSSAVKAVELKASGKGFRVAAYGSEPIPPDNGVPLSAHELPEKRSRRGRSSREPVRDTRDFKYAPSNLRRT